jgi:hypothetical protein
MHRIAVFENSVVDYAEADNHLISRHFRVEGNNTTISIPDHESLFTNDSVEFDNSLFNLSRSVAAVQTANSTCEVMYEWFQQDYLRNRHASNIETDQSTLLQNPLNMIDDLLGQTLCHEGGTFRSTQLEAWNTSNTAKLHEWEFKLIYLAIHDLHHRPAREEHHKRARCNLAFPKHNFQCSESKFLVTNLANLGMGAALRLGAVTHVLTAIATDRVPLFVSNAPTGPKHLRTPWNLVSCERKDFQCVFLPTTPCTISSRDLENAFVMNRSDVSALRKEGIIPDSLVDHRILTVDGLVTAAKGDAFGIHERVQQKIYERALTVIEEWRGLRRIPEGDIRYEFLQAAAKGIQGKKESVKPLQYSYGHRDNRIAHAILLYFLRPNMNTETAIGHRLRKILIRPLKPEKTIGMPIRGSDKCRSESTCLDFDQYMQLAKESWETIKTHHDTYGTLILTTEDEEIFRRRLLFNRTAGFPLDIVVNEEDSLQGSGNVEKFGLNADDILISSLVAIRMQLHAGHVYGNCCSNFHLMIFDFVQEGCGVKSKVTCLQETEKYKVCCEWSKGEDCDMIRKEYRKSIETPQETALREALELLSKHRRKLPLPLQH